MSTSGVCQSRAVGNWLVVEDNHNRVLLYSISTGEQLVRWFSYRPKISRNGQRLCLANGRGHLLVVLDERGSFFVYHVGEKLPFLAADLPLDSLPVLRAAAVTPTLDRIAFSVDGNSAAFQVATGECTYTGPRFSAADFSDQASAYLLLLPRDRINPPRVLQVALASGKTTPAWSGGKDHLRSGGPVLLEYALEAPVRHRFLVIQQEDIPYRLRALDPATGKELWKREFFENSPVPFADPQGDRLVLGWERHKPPRGIRSKTNPFGLGNIQARKNLETRFLFRNP